MRKLVILPLLGLLLPLGMRAQTAVTTDVLDRLEKSFANTPQDKAIRNALGATDMRVLALSQENLREFDTEFSLEVKSKGITDQQSSGRCWLFTGLNVMRAKAIQKYDLPSLEFSQVYLFFYDQLEKSNLFLQGVIDTATRPMDDQMVEWLFRNPLSDGGTFCGVADLALKYGLVPRQAMPETYASNHTSRMNQIVSYQLRQGGLRIRELKSQGKGQGELEKVKMEVLEDVYRILSLTLGTPPKSFEYALKDASGKTVAVESHTPKSFLEKYGDTSLLSDYVMLMNDPTREYYRTYRIDYDRHAYDGKDWTYLNLPLGEIKTMAVESLRSGVSMYFSCDVGKYRNSQRGLLDVANFDYESLLGVPFSMDKRQRIQSFASGSSHAMTLMAVDLDKSGKPTKWKVENSWGAQDGYQGHLIMTDEWFDGFMFRLVLETRFVPEKYRAMLSQKPVALPAWDPMFLGEE